MKNTLVIDGNIYKMAPFTAGQMRKEVDPLIDDAAKLAEMADQASKEGSNNPQMAMELRSKLRSIQRQQADLVVASVRRTVPDFSIDQLDDLTDSQITDLFNRILEFTQAGGSMPEGEAAPQGKRSR